LLNKLGATLANSNRSEEALPLYEEALRSRARYARCWLNLGISHANLGAYQLASQAYLKALHLSPAAKHIWSYLRLTLSHMDRMDLVELVAAEDLRTLADKLDVDAAWLKQAQR
jgi:peroxin-5